MSTTTTARNREAERLERWLPPHDPASDPERIANFRYRVQEALATERRLTVERIRHRLHRGRYRADWSVAQIEQVDALLDELGEQR